MRNVGMFQEWSPKYFIFKLLDVATKTESHLGPLLKFLWF